MVSVGKDPAKTSIRPPVPGSPDERCVPRRTAPVGNRRSRPETGPDSKDFGELIIQRPPSCPSMTKVCRLNCWLTHSSCCNIWLVMANQSRRSGPKARVLASISRWPGAASPTAVTCCPISTIAPFGSAGSATCSRCTCPTWVARTRPARPRRPLVRRAACLIVELEQLERNFALNGCASSAQLLEYGRASNTLRRLLEAVGLQRRPRDVTPSLDEYLRQKANARDELPVEE